MPRPPKYATTVPGRRVRPRRQPSSSVSAGLWVIYSIRDLPSLNQLIISQEFTLEKSKFGLRKKILMPRPNDSAFPIAGLTEPMSP